MIKVAFQLINNWPEIERMLPRLQKQLSEIEQLWPTVQATMNETIRVANDVRSLAERIAPELLVTPERTVPRQEQQFPPTYDVKWLQQSLNTLIDAGLVIDGVYGQQTMAAVKKFQEQHGLVADGWAGIMTESALEAALAARSV